MSGLACPICALISDLNFYYQSALQANLTLF